ncbi:death domain-containing membrane protein NRADD-like isoform X4 [Psammomys obesus]|uniref:death domain-containing membrane protein NRADD-like isoform X4 n=1 Tax=Psammomys obesus TaxID=48139 RepID=UPI00245337CF|nr:death domain-containing membrane protein NRADD-like isoform X4 [Psammomys obesus]
MPHELAEPVKSSLWTQKSSLSTAPLHQATAQQTVPGRAMLHNVSHSKGADYSATVVLGLLAYVAFKCWRSHKQRQQLAKARTVELGDPDRDQRHGDSNVFVDSPCGLEASSQGAHPDLGSRLYLHIPQQQQEEVERLLMLGEPSKGWQGLASHLGYQAEAVETMAGGQVPAYTLLRDWAAQGGSRATLRVLEDALAAIGREDVVQVLSSPAEGFSVV